MANLYTKTGDSGTTSLVGGARVSKADARVDAYGTVDEALSMIGLAKAKCTDTFVTDTLEAVQSRMFALGGELASDERGFERLKKAPEVSEGGASFGPIRDKDVEYLETVCDECTELVGKQAHFVTPGVDEVSAALHCARTIVRRAERRMVEMAAAGDEVRPVTMKYVNRLSDTLFALARYQEERVGVNELASTVLAKVKEALGMNETATPLTLSRARRMAERACEKSEELGVPTVFFAVDAGGNLILSHRMEGSFLGSIEVAQAKAWTAAAFKMPTDELGRAAAPGGPLYSIDSTNPGKVVLFGGGFPVMVDGELTGAIGISGGTVEEDMAIARYALGSE